LAFAVLTVANVFVSLHPRTRRYNIVLFLLSTFALLCTWATEEYQYFLTEYNGKGLQPVVPAPE